MNAMQLTGAAPGHLQLAQLRRSAHSGIWVETLGACALLLVAFALPSFLTDRLLRLEWIFRAILLATFVFVLVRQIRRRLLVPLAVQLSDEEMALAVERAAPDVKQALISSLQFDRELQAGVATVESPALKQAVVADVRARVAAIPFQHAIDAGRVRRFALGIVGALVFFAGWAGFDAKSLGLWAARNLALSNVDWPRYTVLALADSDSAAVRLPQGDALSVRVHVTGPVPDQMFVDYAFHPRKADGATDVGKVTEKGSEVASRTGDAEFTWTIPSVLNDMTLSLQGGDSLPLEVTVTVVERPSIDDLAIKVTYPSYMEMEPEVVPPTEGELRLPKGAVLSFAGKSQKALSEAFVLFGNDQKTTLARGADGKSFAGDFTPKASGLLVVDVIDTDRLGAGTPPKLLLRVGEDKPPTLEFKPRGVGTLITAHARIPGDLKIKDDFGIREVSASFRVEEEKPPEKGQTPPPEVPFAKAEANYRTPLVPSSRRYDSFTQLDLMQWNKVPTEDAPENKIRPGMVFSLRFAAKDNFGPGDPHEGQTETMVFRVVTRDRLAEELRRRQVEQREELQRIADELNRGLLELSENMLPSEAGDKRRQVEARLKALARQQQSLGRRVTLVGELYQKIIWEYENNRLWEPNQARDMEALIPVPLAQLGKDAFPASARLVDTFAGNSDPATKTAAIDSYKEIQARIAVILKNMATAESLAALIEGLKTVIKLENDAIRDVQHRVQASEQDIFKKKPETPKSQPPKENEENKEKKK